MGFWGTFFTTLAALVFYDYIKILLKE